MEASASNLFGALVNGSLVILATCRANDLANFGFELNVYKPVLAYCMMHSIQLLADAARSFTQHCVSGIRADEKRIDELMRRSLMLVTALAPKIGYDNAAKVAKSAHAKGTTLKEEAVAQGFVTDAEFDRLVRPDKMTHPG